jgi:hypothetical protein
VPSVKYVSADNSVIAILKYQSWSGVQIISLDNNTGNVITTIQTSSGYKIYGDKLIYFTYTVQPSQWGGMGSSQYNVYLNYYDFMSRSTVTTSQPVSIVYSSDSQYRPTDPPYTISADGKIILVGYHEKQFTNGGYSWIGLQSYLQTFDLNGNQLVQLEVPVGYPSDGRSGFAISLIGDGKVLLSYYSRDSSSEHGSEYLYVVTTDPDNGPNTFNNGQFYNQNETIDNGEVTAQIKFNFDNFTSTPTVGLSARIQDNKNMYRLEVSPTKSQLVKVVNGVKTVLDSKNYPINWRSYYNIKIKVNGTSIKGYVGGVPLLSATDSTFTSGYFGPYAEMPYVLIKNVAVTRYIGGSTNVANTAIVGTTVDVATSFSDPENDPAIPNLSKWTYTHTQPNKFLDAGDGYSGLSSLNVKTTTTPYLVFDKVGQYKLDYQIPDDPAPAGYKYPDGTFAAYRQYSDVSSHNLIIHRRPIAQFTVSVGGNGLMNWNDTSYDPDRWLSPTNYSTEATGIDYKATKGILQRKYNYSTPSGNTINGQLIRPMESGTYTVREAVADEYGSWSDWYEQSVNVTILPPNNPPSVTLTFPNGTQSNPSYVSSLTPTVTWTQGDPDPGTIFGQARILVKDEWGNTVIDRTLQQNTSSTTGQWQLDTALFIGAKYQVQVMVSDDGGLWSPWSNVGWMITNRPPEAYLSYPYGTQSDPTVVNTLRPTFSWSQTDPDPGTVFQYFQIQVADESNTSILLDSGQYWEGTSSASGSWTANANLPSRKKLRVRVRVFDGYAWSNWSPDAWMLINRSPSADFDWSPKPVWEGDTVRITNNSTDPDGDALTSSWTIRRPDGGTTVYSSTHINGILFAQPGSYDVTLTVSDGLSNSTLSKTIQVSPLTIQAQVNYTPEWLSNHQKSGHNTTAVPKDFYSGEIFVVETDTSPAPVTEVKAWIDTLGLDGNRLQASVILSSSGSPTHFKGELFDNKFMSMTEGIPPGLQQIHFQILYSNGVVKKKDVPVNIIGNVNESVGVHRKQ